MFVKKCSRKFSISAGLGGIFFLLAFSITPGLAALPDGVTLKPYLTPSSTNFSKVISFHEIPGKPGSFLVVEKEGRIVYYEPKTGKSWEWMQLPVFTKYEEGLYTIAFHPDFETNSRYFLYYNPPSNSTAKFLNYGHPSTYKQVLAEFKADAKHERDSGQPRKIIREFCCKDGPGHNGMYHVFGQDGMLYLAFGDGNSDGRHTQSRQTILGTVLRIDVDNPDPGLNYGIPKDNPFIDDPDPKVVKEIWAYGFRNNFKMAVDPHTGAIWVGNVGGWNEDHISLVKKGQNFGWPITEASECFDNSVTMFQYSAPLKNCNRTGITPPTITLRHPDPRGKGNSTCIIGPIIYRSNSNSKFFGAVFYADYTGKQFFVASLDGNGIMAEKKKFAPPPVPIVHFTQASDGRILAMGHGGNRFYYLDHPELLLEPNTVAISRTRLKSTLVNKDGQIYYDVAGKRLIHMPFSPPEFRIKR